MRALFQRCRSLAIAPVAAVLAVLVLLIASSAASALATAEIEPNDDLFQMTGPISPDGATGTIQTEDDVDYFLVRLRPQRQVEFHFSTGSCYEGRFQVETLDGSDIAYDSYLGNNESETKAVTTPGVFGGPSISAKIFVDAGDPGCAYSIGITGPGGAATDAVDASPLPNLPTIGTAEPNDFIGQANGPLAANTYYTGAIETANDKDWLYVPLLGGTTLTMEHSTNSYNSEAELRSSENAQDAIDLEPSTNASKAGSFSVPYSGIYYVLVTGTLGAHYRLQLSPAAAVGYPPPTISFGSHKVKRGISVRVYIDNSNATSLSWKFSRRGHVQKRGQAGIRSGVARIPTRRLHRHKVYSLRVSVPGVGSRTARITIR